MGSGDDELPLGSDQPPAGAVPFGTDPACYAVPGLPCAPGVRQAFASSGHDGERHLGEDRCICPEPPATAPRPAAASSHARRCSSASCSRTTSCRCHSSCTRRARGRGSGCWTACFWRAFAASSAGGRPAAAWTWRAAGRAPCERRARCRRAATCWTQRAAGRAPCERRARCRRAATWTQRAAGRAPCERRARCRLAAVWTWRAAGRAFRRDAPSGGPSR